MLSGSRYESFLSDAQADVASFKERAKEDGTYAFSSDINKIVEFSNRVSGKLMQYLFGDQLGKHLFEKFVCEYDRNFLDFLSYLHSNYKFFLLFEIKNNDMLYSMA